MRGARRVQVAKCRAVVRAGGPVAVRGSSHVRRDVRFDRLLGAEGGGRLGTLREGTVATHAALRVLGHKLTRYQSVANADVRRRS